MTLSELEQAADLLVDFKIELDADKYFTRVTVHYKGLKTDCSMHEATDITVAKQNLVHVCTALVRAHLCNALNLDR